MNKRVWPFCAFYSIYLNFWINYLKLQVPKIATKYLTFVWAMSYDFVEDLKKFTNLPFLLLKYSKLGWNPQAETTFSTSIATYIFFCNSLNKISTYLTRLHKFKVASFQVTNGRQANAERHDQELWNGFFRHFPVNTRLDEEEKKD